MTKIKEIKAWALVTGDHPIFKRPDKYFEWNWNGGKEKEKIIDYISELVRLNYENVTLKIVIKD